jgi:DNA-binding GntR family transcriptional regulator
VREALTRLEKQGLVALQRHRGAVVSKLSIDEVREIFEFRALLEPEVIRLSIELITPAQLKLAAKYRETFASPTRTGGPT